MGDEVKVYWIVLGDGRVVSTDTAGRAVVR